MSFDPHESKVIFQHIKWREFPLEITFYRNKDGTISITVVLTKHQVAINTLLSREETQQFEEKLLENRGKLTHTVLAAVAGTDQLRTFLRENNNAVKAIATVQEDSFLQLWHDDDEEQLFQVIKSMALLTLVETADREPPNL